MPILLPEIIEEIAWSLVADDQPSLLTGLTHLSPFLLASKHVYASLSPGHALSYANGQRYPLRTKLWARLCEAYVDVGAVKRRWWGRLRADGEAGPPTSALTAHLINVVRTLRFYQRSARIMGSSGEPTRIVYAKTIYVSTVQLHLTTTMLLCLEHDEKNMPLLVSVQAPEFVRLLLHHRIPEGRADNDWGWLVENILNTLMLWCFWYVSSGRETLESETLSNRQFLIDLVLPFVVTPFRYASALSPPTHFTLPIPNPSAHPPHVSFTAHGSYPLYYTREHPLSGYQAGPLAIQPPPHPQEEEQVAPPPQGQAPAPLAGTNADVVAAGDAEALQVAGEDFDDVLEHEGRAPATMIENGIAQGADSGTSRPRDEPAGYGEPIAGPSRREDRDGVPPHAPQAGPSNVGNAAHDRTPSPGPQPHVDAPAPADEAAPQALPPAPQGPPPQPFPAGEGAPQAYIPLSTLPRPTPVNSHLHPSSGIHVFWYSSLGLWRAERERVASLVQSKVVPSHGAVDEEMMEVGGPVEIEGKLKAEIGLGKGRKRERKVKGLSHSEARKRSRLDRPLEAGREWRPYSETPEHSGDDGSSSESSDEEVEQPESRASEDRMDVDNDDDGATRRAFEEQIRIIEAEQAKQREEDEEAERQERRRRYYQSFLVHALADEHEYDISARFPECASFDPLQCTSSRGPPFGSPSTTPSPTISSYPPSLSPPLPTMEAKREREKKGESVPTVYNAFAPVRMLLPPASIPAKLIYLSRREMRPLDAPDPTRGVRGTGLPAPPPVAQGQGAPTIEEGQAMEEGPDGEQEFSQDGDVVHEEVPQADDPAPGPAQAPIDPPVAAAPPAGPPPPPQGPPPAPPATFQRGPTPEDIIEYSTWRVAKVRGYASYYGDMPEATSLGYDTEWARMVLCWRITDAVGGGNASAGRVGAVGYSSGKQRERVDKGKEKDGRVMWPSPSNRSHSLLKWRTGRVYERGMLTGLWQGKIYFIADLPITVLARARPFPMNLAEDTLGLSMRPMYVRFTEHGKVRVPGVHDDPFTTSRRLDDSDIRGDDSSSAVVHNAPIPGSTLVASDDQHVHSQTRQWTDDNMNNGWIEGQTGSLVWEDGRASGGQSESDTLLVGGLWGDGSTRDRNVEARKAKERGNGGDEGMKMGSVAFCVPGQRGMGEDDVGVKRYVYETYEKGGECAHSRMVGAKDAKSVRGLCLPAGEGEAEEYFYTHPGCLQCAERERVAKIVRETEEKEKSEWKRAMKRKEQKVDRERKRKEEERLVAELAAEAEKMFASHGLGMDEDVADEDDEDARGRKEVVNVEFGSRPRTKGGWTPIASHSRTPHHSRHTSLSSSDQSSVGEDTFGDDPLADYAFDSSHLPTCDDGIEDTVLTGDVDERQANAWGRFVCYGRVRPWDGLVGFIRLQILPPEPGEGLPQPAAPFVQQNGGGRRHGPMLEGVLGAKLFFYGYIHAGKTIVGNWRYTGIDATAATVESAFMISRKED